VCVTGLLFAEIHLKFHSDVIKYLFTFMSEGEKVGWQCVWWASHIRTQRLEAAFI